MTNLAAPMGVSRADLARQGAVVGALAATLAVNTLANLLPLNGQTTGEISDRFPLRVTPPGYVFGIWGLIYTGLLAYAIYQALPAQARNPALRRIAWPFVISCGANAAWLLLWHYNQYGLTLGAMVGLLLALVAINLRLGRAGELSATDALLARLPFSVYLGWISVATIVNASVALSAAGWGGAGLSPQAWTAGLLGVGAGLGAAMGLGRGDGAFPLVLAWAFSGVAVKNGDAPLVANTAWAATAAALLAAAGALLRRR